MSIPNFNPKKKVFIIAEVGNNHEGNFDVAKKLIRAAAKAGVDAVKFQTFVTNDFVNSDHPSFERLKKFELTQQQFSKLKKLANTQNLNFISTPLDFSSAHFLKKNCKIIKIASGDNNFYDLINIFLDYNKQLIISTGMMNALNVKNLIEFIIKKKGKKFLKNNLSLLHCVSSYPAEQKSLNLMSIRYLADIYKKINIGYSDHAIGYDACVTAVALGARIVEKHFTLNNNFSNFRDHKLSLNPQGMKNLTTQLNQANLMFGNFAKEISLNEKKNLHSMRRSFYATQDILKGEIITKNKIKFVRPFKKLLNKNYIMNRKTKKKILANNIISKKDLI